MYVGLSSSSRAVTDSDQSRHALLAAVRQLIDRSKADQALPPNMRLAFFSGVPKIGNGDVWGGTGDVAANVLMARKFKARNPDCDVTFIVVDYAVPEFQRRSTKFPSLESATSLVTRMVPALDPERTDSYQNVDGINFYFPSIPLLQRSPSGAVERAPILPFLPSADVALLFNDNRSRLAAVLEPLAPLRFIIDEPGRDHEPLRRTDGRDQIAREHRLNSGPKHLGYYVSPTSSGRIISRSSRLEVLAALKARTGQQLGVDATFAFVYCGREWCNFDYVCLLNRAAALHGIPVHVLVVGGTHISDSFSHARVINLGQIDHLLFEKLVWLSDFPPVVTGDVSFSLAIEASERGRGLIYSRPSWKAAAVADLYEFILNRFTALTGNNNARHDFAAKLRASLWAGGGDIAAGDGGATLIEAICSQRFQSSFAATLNTSLCEISMSKNLELFMIWTMMAQEVFVNAAPPQALDDGVFGIIRQSYSLADFAQRLDYFLRSTG
jgi:hypothetical protein